MERKIEKVIEKFVAEGNGACRKPIIVADRAVPFEGQLFIISGELEYAPKAWNVSIANGISVIETPNTIYLVP